MSYYNQDYEYDDSEDELDELRREEAHKRKYEARLWRNPDPRDPDYVGPDTDDIEESNYLERFK